MTMTENSSIVAPIISEIVRASDIYHSWLQDNFRHILEIDDNQERAKQLAEANVQDITYKYFRTLANDLFAKIKDVGKGIPEVFSSRSFADIRSFMQKHSLYLDFKPFIGRLGHLYDIELINIMQLKQAQMRLWNSTFNYTYYALGDNICCNFEYEKSAQKTTLSFRNFSDGSNVFIEEVEILKSFERIRELVINDNRTPLDLEQNVSLRMLEKYCKGMFETNDPEKFKIAFSESIEVHEAMHVLVRNYFGDSEEDFETFDMESFNTEDEVMAWLTQIVYDKTPHITVGNLCEVANIPAYMFPAGRIITNWIEIVLNNPDSFSVLNLQLLSEALSNQVLDTSHASEFLKLHADDLRQLAYFTFYHMYFPFFSNESIVEFGFFPQRKRIYGKTFDGEVINPQYDWTKIPYKKLAIPMLLEGDKLPYK